MPTHPTIHFLFNQPFSYLSFQVSRYLDAPDIITGNTSPIDPAFKQRLLRHLDSCVSELDLDLGSRPDSGLGSSPGSVTDRVLGPGSPVPLDHPHHAVAAAAAAAAAAHCSAALGAALIKQEIPELEAARPDSSTAPGDENNNSSRPTSAFGQVHPAAVAGMPGMEQPGVSQANPNMLSVVQVRDHFCNFLLYFLIILLISSKFEFHLCKFT